MAMLEEYVKLQCALWNYLPGKKNIKMCLLSLLFRVEIILLVV